MGNIINLSEYRNGGEEEQEIMSADRIKAMFENLRWIVSSNRELLVNAIKTKFDYHKYPELESPCSIISAALSALGVTEFEDTNLAYAELSSLEDMLIDQMVWCDMIVDKVFPKYGSTVGFTSLINARGGLFDIDNVADLIDSIRDQKVRLSCERLLTDDEFNSIFELGD